MVETERSMTKKVISESADSDKKRRTITVSGNEYHISDICKLISRELKISEKLTIRKGRGSLGSTMFVGKESGNITAILDGDVIHIPGTMKELGISGIRSIYEKERLVDIGNKIKDDIEYGKWCDHNSGKCFCEDLPDQDTSFIGDCEYVNIFTNIGEERCRWLLSAYQNNGYRGRERRILTFAMKHNKWINTEPKTSSTIQASRVNTRKSKQSQVDVGNMDRHVCSMRL